MQHRLSAGRARLVSGRLCPGPAALAGPPRLRPGAGAGPRRAQRAALKGDSYRLRNRDLGRVPAAGTTEE